MKSIVILLFVCCEIQLLWAQSPHERDTITEQILAVVEKQLSGWNDGNIESFMQGYQPSDSLRFASGGEVTYGWKNMLERYHRKYSTKNQMGHLTFTGITVDVLSGNAALVFGEWRLTRETDQPWGLFTLLFKNDSGAWRIVHDHTSSGH